MSSLVIDNPALVLACRADLVVNQACQAVYRAHRAHRGLVAVALVPAIPKLFKGVRLLDKVVEILNSPALDKLSDEEVKNLAHLLSQASGRANRMLSLFTKAGVRQLFPYRKLLDQVENENSHLLSIIEGLHLSVSAEFVGMVAAAADELASSRDGSERSALVGHV